MDVQQASAANSLSRATCVSRAGKGPCSRSGKWGQVWFPVPHPFRFAILRNEIESCGHGFGYQQTEPYRYPSPWKADVFLEHPTPRISDYLNAITSAGLRLAECEEPCATQEFREIAPEKAEWMDRYVGIILFRANKNGWGGTDNSHA